MGTKKYVDYTMSMVDRAIVLGEIFTSIFNKWLLPANIDIVPNGTDLIIPQIAKKLERTDIDPFTVTFLSSLMRSKGILEFVQAALLCLEKMPNMRFCIAGEWWNEDDTIRKETFACIPNEKIEKIRFLGLVTGEDKIRLYSETDIFVLPTYYPFEGQPTVIIEAMAAGCPVISTPHAAIPETVIDGVTGILVPPKSPRGLADAILHLVNKPDVYRSMAVAGYQRYLEFYTTEKSNELLLTSLRTAHSQ